MDLLKRALLTCSILIGCATLASAGVIVQDNWSDGTVQTPTVAPAGVDWKVEAGSFSVYGPYLKFEPESKISIDFGQTVPGTPVEARFKVYNVWQSAGWWRFVSGLKNTKTGYYYQEANCPNPTMYANLTGFHNTIQTGPGPDDWTLDVGDVPGSSLSLIWDYVKMKFDPSSGVEIWYTSSGSEGYAYDDPSLTYTRVAHWSNFFNIQSVNQFYLDGGTVLPWFVYDVQILGYQMPAAEPANLTATVNLSDYSAGADSVGVIVDLLQSGVVAKTFRLFADDTGRIAIAAPAGTYDVAVKGTSSLRAMVSNVTISAGSITDLGTVTLINGDIDGDNEVTSTDLSILGLNLGLTGE